MTFGSEQNPKLTSGGEARPRRRGLLLAVSLALLGSALVYLVLEPYLYLWQERRAQQRTAELYLESHRLPEYPRLTLVERLVSHENHFGEMTVSSKSTAFHSNRSFAEVKTWYARALPAPPWKQMDTSVPGLGQNWEAERTQGNTTTRVRVNAPSGARFVAVVYMESRAVETALPPADKSGD